MFRDQLAKLFHDNRANRTPLRVAAAGDGSASVWVYDAIGWMGVEAKDFAEQISAIDAGVIHLRIDSPGGDVFAARAMKIALEQHPARVIAHVDGLAASAASFLMLGADEIEIAEGGFVMIHNAWALAMGDRREMNKMAEVLEKIDGAIRNDYAAHTGRTVEEFAGLMDAETWFTAVEAVEIGLADRVYTPVEQARNRFDLSAYANTPKALTAPEAADDMTARVAANLRRLTLLERTAA